MSKGGRSLPSLPQPLRIDYESEGFSPHGPVSNGYAVLDTSWDDLLWAALTVGRPNRQYVFRHGLSSTYEALFRLSLLRMALEQRGPTGSRLWRTAAVRTLDPSEKGAVNYFLGMIMCKLFSAKLLNAPWVLHLDVFRPQLDPVLKRRSRPDLVGQTVSGEWVVLESKGRVSMPGADAKNKANLQAEEIESVGGTPPSFQIGGITCFRNDVLQFYWQDPEHYPSDGQKKIKLVIEEEMWGSCYLPTLEILHSKPDHLTKVPQAPLMMPIDGVDVKIGIHPRILKYLLEGKWEAARQSCFDHKEEIHKNGYQPDGVRVIAGPSWLQPFSEFSKNAEAT